MPVPDGFFARTGLIDDIQWQGNFDELLLVGHAVSMEHLTIRNGSSIDLRILAADCR